MRLTDLIPHYSGINNPEILGLSQDSRDVRRGWLFAAFPGSRADGRSFVADAIRNGAAAILGSSDLEVDGVAFAASDNPRRDFALAAARFYNAQPENIVAVTGTNGKTSTVSFVQQIEAALGRKAASLGTLGLRGVGVECAGSMTTPDPVTLHAQLADLAAVGFTHLAMEASSHGLHQHRLDGVRVSAAGFTNLTRDHLDYHANMDEYLAAKAKLFTGILRGGGTAVINADVPEFSSLAKICRDRDIRVIGYGHKGADLTLKSREALPEGQMLEIAINGKTHRILFPVVGAFQAMNMLCALGLTIADGTSVEKILEAVKTLKGPPGRLQFVGGHKTGAAVYVDYAHTPDALENVIAALRPHTTGRLVCVVGCGGDRDPGKRPIMGRIAATQADIAIITDDNPRSEDPAKIRAAMMADAPKAREIPGRREAINEAVASLRAGDVLIIAGKGHEQGQIIGKVTEPFDDVTEALKAIEIFNRGKAV